MPLFVNNPLPTPANTTTQAGVTGQIAERYAVDRSAADNKASQKVLLAAYKQLPTVGQRGCPVQDLFDFECRLSLAMLSVQLQPPQRQGLQVWEEVPAAILRPAVWATLDSVQQLVQQHL